MCPAWRILHAFHGYCRLNKLCQEQMDIIRVLSVNNNHNSPWGLSMRCTSKTLPYKCKWGHLADPGQVGEAAQIGILHWPRLWPVGCDQQPSYVQLLCQLALHLRVLRQQVPGHAQARSF